jgi:5-methylcytosine-specific restriction protein A
MALSEILSTIGSSYEEAKLQGFGGHPLANIIRREWPLSIAELLQSHPNLEFKGSAGQGRWTDSPWAAIFDPIVTSSAETGYYPVFLFSENFREVSLVMGQGTYEVRKEFGRGTLEILEMRAKLLRQRVPEFRQRFNEGPFPIKSSAHAGDDWSVSSAWGKKYNVMALPSNEVLGGDLVEMVNLYRLATQRGGIDLAEGASEMDGNNEESSSQSQLEGARRERFHFRIERQRNNRLSKEAKRIHGYECQGCGFSFESVYGIAGRNYIEAHHLTPLHALSGDGPVLTNPETDFAVLCANCHKMIHAMGCPSLDEFKSAISR